MLPAVWILIAKNAMLCHVVRLRHGVYVTSCSESQGGGRVGLEMLLFVYLYVQKFVFRKKVNCRVKITKPLRGQSQSSPVF